MFVYILQCADGSYYVGHTADLAERERVHNEGRGSRFTATRLPVHVVYAEEWKTPGSAVVRERQLKRWTAQKKQALIRHDHATLKALARRRT